MTIERVSHDDLIPTFRQSASVTDTLSSERDWGALGAAFLIGVTCGALLMGLRQPVIRAARKTRDLVREKAGGTAEGPHAPFDPRTRDRNVGVGALSEQQYRSLEESRDLETVTEASEESFPASDPPAWTGVSVGRCSPESEC